MNNQDLLDLGVEAYIFLYPLVTMDATRRVMTNAPAGAKPGIGPMGVFHHMRAFPDADGNPYISPSRYVMHFDKDELPPVAAFWSITMYDNDGFQCANELDRFAIGDRDALQVNADGSLDLYFQHDNPGPDKVSNWLPAPEGAWNLTMRLYAPKAAVLDGSWNPPPVRKVN